MRQVEAIWMRRNRTWLPATLLILLAASCGSGPARTYEAAGQITAIAEDRTSVTIAHEDIKGFMPAMTMLFPVKDSAELAGISRNDLVRFDLMVTPQESWAANLRRTGRGEESPAATSTAATLSPGEELRPFTLLNQHGTPVELADFAGKPLAITFIFTRCPIPEYCPRFTDNFARVQRTLADRFPGQFQLLSVTVDPEYDTPQVLEEYGKRNGADFAIWSMLTGGEDEIRKLAGQFGVQFWTDGATITHTGICVLIRSDGTVHKIHRGNIWTAGEIIQNMEHLIGHEAS